jgi:hypothetical protein
MDKIKVHVGTRRTLRSGQVDDNLTPVEFEAEELANVTAYHGDNDTRGVTETLYRTADDRLVVYVEDWTKWQGEPSHFTLQEADEEDLGPGGRFERLGRQAGMGRPMTLDEAIQTKG